MTEVGVSSHASLSAFLLLDPLSAVFRARPASLTLLDACSRMHLPTSPRCPRRLLAPMSLSTAPYQSKIQVSTVSHLPRKQAKLRHDLRTNICVTSRSSGGTAWRLLWITPLDRSRSGKRLLVVVILQFGGITR